MQYFVAVLLCMDYEEAEGNSEENSDENEGTTNTNEATPAFTSWTESTVSMSSLITENLSDLKGQK